MDYCSLQLAHTLSPKNGMKWKVTEFVVTDVAKESCDVEDGSVAMIPRRTVLHCYCNYVVAFRYRRSTSKPTVMAYLSEPSMRKGKLTNVI
ncbi:hypothetical protein RB195_018001 [Necator americanus]|uniref:Uncharacterized protein n=1 Tax=Necator americanus TaxID=51031 RepID=A0ABR1CAU4_NECAM